MSVEYSLVTLEITAERLANFEQIINKCIIQKPNKELVKMYEMSKILDLTKIRAEKYDSIEFQEELKALKVADPTFKVQRGQQNPNYTKIFETLNNLRSLHETWKKDVEKKPETVKNVEEAKKYLEDIISVVKTVVLTMNDEKIMIQKLSVIPDVRVISDLPMYFNYLYSKYVTTE